MEHVTSRHVCENKKKTTSKSFPTRLCWGQFWTHTEVDMLIKRRGEAWDLAEAGRESRAGVGDFGCA